MKIITTIISTIFILLFIWFIVAIVAFVYKTGGFKSNKIDKKYEKCYLDRKTVIKLVNAYSSGSFLEMKQLDNGFMGDMGSATVKYDEANKKLIVWAVVSTNGYKYIARPKYLEEIKHMAKLHPEIMAGSEIDLIKFPEYIYGASKDGQPWLTLKKEFLNPQLSTEEFVSYVKHLTDLSHYEWRPYMRKAHQTVNVKYGLPRKDQIIPNENK